LASAIASYETSAGDRRAYAMAKLALADEQLEQYLGLAFPVGLSFDPANKARMAESLERFNAWLGGKSNLGETLHAQYEAIVALGDPVGAVAAASRLGMLAKSFSDDLFTAA